MATQQTAPDPAPASGFVALASGIFVRPREVGEAVAQRMPTGPVLAAIAVILALVLGGAFLTAPILQKEQIEQIRHNTDMPAQQREVAVQFMESPAGRMTIILPQPVVVVIGMCLVSLLLFLGQSLMAGRAGYAATFAVTAFSCLISFGAGTVVRTALCLAKGSFLDVSTGLGVLVSDRPPNDALRAALDVIDVFTLWAAVSAGIALAPPARLKPATTITVSLVVYFVLMSIGAAARVLFMR